MGLKGYRLWVMHQLVSNVQSPTARWYTDSARVFSTRTPSDCVTATEEPFVWCTTAEEISRRSADFTMMPTELEACTEM
jgi:hypothetical protein